MPERGVNRRASTPSSGRSLKSTDTGVRILTALTDADGPLTLTDLAARTGAGASTAHRHLAGFVDAGLVRQDRSGGTYDLGPVALQIGLAALARLDVIGLAEPRLRFIAEETGLTALLSVWGDRGPTIVRWQRAAIPFVTSLGLGSVLPATRSATGLAFLAFLPTAATEAALRKQNVGKLADPSTLDRCRSRRHIHVDGTVVPGLRAVASPILDLQGEAAAVITLIGADTTIADPAHKASAVLCDATAELSAALGYRDPAE